jgi:chromosome segregation ATPase
MKAKETKVFKVADIRDLEIKHSQDEITYARMVEIMNEMASKAIDLARQEEREKVAVELKESMEPTYKELYEKYKQMLSEAIEANNDMKRKIQELKQENESLKVKVKEVLNHIRTKRKDYPGFGATEIMLKEILSQRVNPIETADQRCARYNQAVKEFTKDQREAYDVVVQKMLNYLRRYYKQIEKTRKLEEENERLKAKVKEAFIAGITKYSKGLPEFLIEEDFNEYLKSKPINR